MECAGYAGHSFAAHDKFAVNRLEFYLGQLIKRNPLSATTKAFLIITRKTLPLGKLHFFQSLILFLIVLIGSTTNGQTAKPGIKVTVSLPETLRVEIRFSQPVRTLSFLDSYAGAIGLGQRIDEFRASVPLKVVAPGEVRAEHDVAELSYRIRLPLSPRAAHVSWLARDSGLLQLADLVPTDLAYNDVDISFDVPDGWRIYSSEAANGSGSYFVRNPSKAAFLIGSDVKSISRRVEGTAGLDVAVVGNLPFKEQRAASGAERVLKKYVELTRFRLPAAANLIIATAPLARGEKWQAETRGTTVVLIFDPKASFKNWVAQLEVILTHEFLHLWVPNALRLEGDYDWFFEGFTLYQALLTALELKLISFDEYLNTLARVYNSYQSYVDTLSLIEASEQRWTAVGSPVYDKGMLVAFLYDLEVRHYTHGQSNLSGRYAELFRKYAGKTVDANEAIMSVLMLSPTIDSLLKSYVQNRRTVDLQEPLQRFGISVQPADTPTRLRVATGLTDEQLRILRSIGYGR